MTGQTPSARSTRPAVGGEPLGQARGQRGLRQVVEPQRHPLRLQEPRDGAKRVRFAAATHDEIEIVGAGVAGAEELEPREPGHGVRRDQ